MMAAGIVGQAERVIYAALEALGWYGEGLVLGGHRRPIYALP